VQSSNIVCALNKGGQNSIENSKMLQDRKVEYKLLETAWWNFHILQWGLHSAVPFSFCKLWLGF